ncbi:hypothetical protein ES705_26697 [subsurface metagenome]
MYNSLWAGASVNSKHYQIYYSNQYIFKFIEEADIEWTPYGDIAIADLKDYPGNIFAIKGDNKHQMALALWMAVNYMQERNIPFEFAARDNVIVVIPTGKEGPSIFEGVPWGVPEKMGLLNVMDKKLFERLTYEDIAASIQETTLPDGEYKLLLREYIQLLSSLEQSEEADIGKNVVPEDHEGKTNPEVAKAMKEKRFIRVEKAIIRHGILPDEEKFVTERGRKASSNLFPESPLIEALNITLDIYRDDPKTIQQIDSISHIFLTPEETNLSRAPPFIWNEDLKRYQVAHAGRGLEHKEQNSYIPYVLIYRLITLLNSLDKDSPQYKDLRELIALIIRHEAKHAWEKATTGKTIEDEAHDKEVREIIEKIESYFNLQPDLSDSSQANDFSSFITSLKDNLPLDFVNLSLSDIREIVIPSWPGYKDYSSKEHELLPETKLFLSLPSLVDSLFVHTFRYSLHIVYSLAYLRQLSPDTRKKVLKQLSDLGYGDLSEWLSKTYNLRLDDLMDSIKRTYPGVYTTEQLERLEEFIALRDRIIGRARSLRVGIEALIYQQGDEGYRAVKECIKEHPDLLEILYGIKRAAIIDIDMSKDRLKAVQEILWALRQVEGLTINILPLGGNKYYVYDEYFLKQRSPKGIRHYTLTKEGLEHRIKLDIAREAGMYHDLPGEFRGASFVEKELMKNLTQAVLLSEPDKRFCKWDSSARIYRGQFPGSLALRTFNLKTFKVDVNTTATMNREKALFAQMEAELEAETIFGNRIPQVVIDDSDPEIFAANARNLDKLSKYYGVKIIHLSGLNRVADQRQFALQLANEYQELLKENKLPDTIRNILEEEKTRMIKGKEEKYRILENNEINIENMVYYIKHNVFEHISGVRNYTVLIVHGLVK